MKIVGMILTVLIILGFVVVFLCDCPKVMRWWFKVRGYREEGDGVWRRKK